MTTEDQNKYWDLENIELLKLLANYKEIPEWYEEFDNFFRNNRKDTKDCRIFTKHKRIARTFKGQFWIPVTRYYGRDLKNFCCKFQLDFIKAKKENLHNLFIDLFYANTSQHKLAAITNNSYTARNICNIVNKKKATTNKNR